MISFELESLLRLLLATVLGGLVGLERQTHGRPAGLRTQILVCVGAALIMIVAESLGEGFDPGRAIAGIVTGIGFLGAGVIIKAREVVRGLTTAACIWFVAAIGIVVGHGLYLLAVGCTAIGLGVLIILGRMEHHIPAHSYFTATVFGRSVDPQGLARQCEEIFSAGGYRVMSMGVNATQANDEVTLVFRLRTRYKPPLLPATKDLLALPGVVRVQLD